MGLHDQKLTVGHLVDIRKQSALEEVEESEPEPKQRTLTVLQLTETLGLTKADMKMFEDIDWNEQRAATSGQGIVRFLLAARGF
jgi:hypothetical protein